MVTVSPSLLSPLLPSSSLGDFHKRTTVQIRLMEESSITVCPSLLPFVLLGRIDEPINNRKRTTA
jgi:hypothetical protein